MPRSGFFVWCAVGCLLWCPLWACYLSYALCRARLGREHSGPTGYGRRGGWTFGSFPGDPSEATPGGEACPLTLGTTNSGSSSSSNVLGPGTLMATDSRGSAARGWDNQVRKRVRKPERRDVGNKGVPQGFNQGPLALPATTCAPVSASRTTKPRTRTRTRTRTF